MAYQSLRSLYPNFRDMGGLECPDGKRIQSWKLYRGPVVIPKNVEEWELFSELGLDRIIDLRTEEERREKPDQLPEGCTYVHAPAYGAGYKYIPVTNRAKLRVISLRGKREQKLMQEKRRSYRELPFSDAYKAIFDAMDRGETIFFHCTEGKDRTGIGALLVELALGRTWEQATVRYMKSNQYRPPKNRDKLKYIGVTESLLSDIHYCESVHEDLLLISKSEILARYASIEEYLEKQFGVTEERRERWKTFYLE